MNELTLRKAMQGYQFSSYTSESQIEDVVRWKICDAMKLRGQVNMDESILSTAVRKVAEVILRDYPSMTDKEFEIMLEAGISGELTPKETWVSGAMILQWMRLYYRHPSRLKIIDELDEEQKSYRMTKAELEEKNRAACENKLREVYAYYKETGDIFDENEVIKARDPRAFATPQFAAVVYNYYRAEGKIPDPEESRIQAANQYATEKVLEARTQNEWVKSAMQDWRDAYLLREYLGDAIKRTN
jgi:hypothetical protein